MPDRPLRYCQRDDTAFIEVAGSDARSFLHAQLSLAIPALPWSMAPLAGWHDPKGQVRALFRLVPRSRSWLLMTPRSSAQGLAAKLSMFVLRADVEIAILDELTLVSVVGGTDEKFARLGIPSAGANATAESGGVYRLRVGAGLAHGLAHPTPGTDARTATASVGRRLAHLIGPPETLARLVANCKEAPGALAELAEIELGIPTIAAATENRFVAQMLNLVQLGAISFDKGCYPGQEVIARVHNLGSVKRRARRFAVEPGTRAEPGAAVRNAADSVVGEVVRAAEYGERNELLAVVALAASTEAMFVHGKRLKRLALPWDDQSARSGAATAN